MSDVFRCIREIQSELTRRGGPVMIAPDGMGMSMAKLNPEDETVAIVDLGKIEEVQKKGYALLSLIDTTEVITVREDAVAAVEWKESSDSYSRHFRDRSESDPLCYTMVDGTYAAKANRSDDPRVASLYKQIVVTKKKAVMRKSDRLAEMAEQISKLTADLSVAQQHIDDAADKIASEKCRADRQTELAAERLGERDSYRERNRKMESDMAQIRRDLAKAKEYVGQKGWKELFPSGELR